MSLLTVTRADFLGRYDKENTRGLIGCAFLCWDSFIRSKSLAEADIISELRKESNKAKRYVLLDQFVQFAKVQPKRKDPTRLLDASTVKMYFQYVKAWLKYNEIELDDSKIKSEIRFPKKVKDRVRGIDGTMIYNMIKLCSPFYQGVFYCLTYSLKRIRSELLNMQWSWIDFTKSPLQIIIPGAVTKTSEERITFLGMEAEEWLRKERENRKDEPLEQYVFRTLKLNTKTHAREWRRLSYNAAYKYFAKRRITLGYDAKSSTGRYHFRPHKLRAYGESMISRAVGEEFAHAIAGHGENLGMYFKGGTTDEQARQDYIKSMPMLAISPEGKLRDENEKLKEQNLAINEVKRKQELLEAFLQSNPRFAKEFARFRI